mgnify:FL=1
MVRVRGALDMVAFRYEGEPPFLIGGLTVVPAYANVGHVWAITTDEARGRGVALTRLAREVLRSWFERHKLQAMVTYALLDGVENRRWLGMLGFVPLEGGHSVMMDEQGVSWKGYVRWHFSAAVEEVQQRSQSPTRLITARSGSNTPAGVAT